MRFSSPRFTFLSLVVLLLGVGLWVWHSSGFFSKKTAAVKSVEQYWAETSLKQSVLEDLISDSQCHISERHYLACANAIISVANRYNLKLNSRAELVPVDSQSVVKFATEKNQLKSWVEIYRLQKVPNGHSKLRPFIKTWIELRQKYIPTKQLPFMVGLGVNGFMSVYNDPHTYILPVALYKEVVAKADYHSSSLGITIANSDGTYLVRKILEGSAANKAGLQRGDILLEINKQSVQGLLQARVLEIFKGDAGSTVELKVQRGHEKLKFKIRRDEMMVATVSTRVIDGIKPIAVIGINKFAKGTCEKMKEALVTVNKGQVRGLLLDLRDNPGGQMEEAACVASLFLGQDKKVFEVRYLDSTKKIEDFYGSEKKIFDRPVAVLVNAGSASASEIVAGALRDYNRAVLVGERTFGKGSFQEGEYWPKNRKIALFTTKGFYYLPSGRSPQLTGLEPDVAVKFDNIPYNREKDQYLNPLVAPNHKVDSQRAVFSMKDCFDLNDSNDKEDVQIAKASQVLFCGKAVAGVGL